MAVATTSALSVRPRFPYDHPSSCGNSVVACHSVTSARNLSHRHETSLSQTRRFQPESPSSAAFALERCIAEGSLRKGLQIHARLLRLGLLSCDDTHLLLHLFLLYSSSGRPEAAAAVLRLIPSTALIPLPFIRNLAGAFPEHVVDLFLYMLVAGLRPNEFTFPFILRSSSLLGLLFLGRQLHSQMLKYGLLPQNIFCATALLDMYSKLAPFSDAQKLFDRIPNRNEVTWNCMISALVVNDLLESGLEMVEMMEDDGIEAGICSWNSFLAGCVRGGNTGLALEILGEMASSSSGTNMNAATFNTFLPAIPKILSSNILKELHGFALRKISITDISLTDEDRLWSALTTAYSFHGLMDYALRLFEVVTLKTPHTWISIVAGLLKCNRTHEAFMAFREISTECVRDSRAPSSTLLSLLLPECMSKSGLEIHAHAIRKGVESSTSVGNALMAMYSKKGDVGSALSVFERILEKDVVSWNTMAAAYSSAHDFAKAFELFHRMLAKEIKPDEYSFSSVLNGCGHSSQPCQATALHGRLIKSGFSQSFVTVQNSLMNAYGKCGWGLDARRVFDEMDSRDIISWNTIISCCGFSDHPHEAFLLFDRMKAEGLKPNRVTFVVLLSACSHAGMLEEGLRYFETMSTQYGIIPDVSHYACMVDSMGRKGELHRAFEFIKNMPVEPDDCIWSALLGSCRIHGDLELAEVAAMNLIALKPQHSGYWVLLSNMYSDVSKWEDAATVRAAMKDGGVRKCPGYSWIEIGESEVHRFLSADISHKDKLDIYASLQGLTMQLKDEGYIPCSDYYRFPSKVIH